MPTHLTAQEDFLLADNILRQQTQGLPFYGIARLEWDEALLKKGGVFIKAFQLILPSYSRVVDYPNNAHIVSTPIELADLREPALYYFVLEELRSETNPHVKRPETNLEGITRRYYKLIFSVTQQLPANMEYLLADYNIEYQGCLGHFRQNAQGAWEVTDQYIPPLTQLGSSPYLCNTLNQLHARLQHYRDYLHKSYVSEPQPLKTYSNLSNCLRSVQFSLFVLGNLTCLRIEPGEIKPHPYLLYEALYRLYLDLMLHQEQWPQEPTLPYRHERIHDAYQDLLGKLQTLLNTENRHLRSKPFILKEGIYLTSLPEHTQKTDELYFIIKLHDLPAIQQYDLPKISSQSRLNMMYDYSLKGVKLNEVNGASLGYDFGKNTQCFQIGQDQETEHIFTDNSLAFYDSPELRGYDFHVCIRQ